jgi:hypothetical protein
LTVPQISGEGLGVTSDMEEANPSQGKYNDVVKGSQL